MPDPIAAAPETVTPPASILDSAPDPTPSVAQSATPVVTESTVVTPTPAAPATEGWGDKWREQVAGDDEKALARLGRYQSPKALVTALFEAQKKISAGDFAKALPKDATPEQLIEWRIANGIPEKPEQYFEKLPDGVVLGEQDRALFNSFAEKMHAKNVAPEVMHEVVAWYNEFQQKTLEEMVQKDTASLDATQNALRDEWGADFRANVNMIAAHLGSEAPGLKERLMGARAADGTPLINDPAVMNYFAKMAREINPAATLVSGTGNSAAGVDDEIASIEKTMRLNRKEYLRDERMQSRYRDLIEARDRLARKAG